MVSTAEFISGLRKMVKDYKVTLELYEVVKYDSTNKKITIKRPYEKTTFDNVIIGGVGLGDNKGIVVGFEVGDYVLVLDMMGQLVIVSTINNIFFPSKKDIQIWPKGKEIIIQNTSLSRIKLTEDGGFKVYNKNGYGIDCDASGNVKIRGTTITYTQTPGDFNN